MATLLKGKYIADNSIPNAKLIQITEANKVAGSAIQLNTTSGALINASGLKVAVDNSTVKISNNKLTVGKITNAQISGYDLSTFIKKDGSVPMTGTLNLGNHKISNVLSATLSSQAVNYGQLINALAQISGSGSEPGDGLYKTGITLNVGAGAGIVVTSNAVGIANNGIKNAMISSGTIRLDKLLSGSQIALRNGANGGFTTTISGITPTIAAHLATKGYVDTNFYTKTYADLNFATSGEIASFITSAQIRVVKDPSPKLSGNLNANRKIINKVSSLGVNTSSPSDKFQVNDSGADPVVITSTGRFGLGKISPSYRMDVYDNRATAAVGNIVNNAATGWGLIVNLPNNISSDGYILDLQSGGFSRARFKPNGDVSITGNLKIGATISSVGATNKIRFYYNALGDRPAANTNNGLMAYVQATDKLYFAGGTTWRRLIESSDLTNYLTSTQIANTYATLNDINPFLTSAEINTNYVTSGELKNLNLTDLKNVICSTATTGQTIKFNGTNWVNSSVGGGVSNLSQLGDVQISSLITGQVLKYNGTKWVNSADIGNTFVLSDGIVTSNKLATNAVVTTKINNAAVTSNKLASGSVTLAKLAPGTAAKQVMKYNGSAWIASQETLNDIRNVVISGAATGQVIGFNGTNWVNVSNTAATNLDALTDVTLSSRATKQVLKYNGSMWINSQETLNDIKNVVISSAATDQLIKFNGTNWTNWTFVLSNGSVTSSKLATNAVVTAKIADANVTSNKLITNAVTSNKIAANAVVTGKINTGAVTSTKLAAGSVISGKIADGNVISIKLATGAVISSKIGTDAVVTAKILNGNVTSTKLATGSVVSSKIATNAVVTAKIADANVTSSKLASGSVLSSKIGTNAVTTAKIINDAITSDKLAAGSVLSAAIGTSAVVTTKIADANVTSNKLAAGVVVSSKLATNSVTTTKINAAAVTSAKISSGSIVAAKIATGAVTSTKIAAGAVLSSKITNAAIINSKISANAVTGSKIRLQNNEWLRARNSTDSADINIIKVSGNNAIIPNFGLNDLDDTNIGAVTSGQVLKYNGTKWINAPDAPGTTNLDSLGDVIISSASAGQILKFDGTNWVNSTIAVSGGGATTLNDLTDVVLSNRSTGQVMIYNGSSWVNSSNKISKLSDVSISNAVISKETGEGNVLLYNGSSWQNKANMLMGRVFSFHLPAKSTILSRAASAINVPSGWKVLAAVQDSTQKHRLGTSSSDLLISHDVGTFVWDLKVMEVDTTGPFTTRYANIKDFNQEDEIRNSLSDAGSGVDGKPSCVRILDLQGNLQVANEAIVIVRFL